MHTQVAEMSNMHEMFYVSSESGESLANRDVYGTFAHEFTHMIGYYHQRNEQTWWSEGAAQLGEYINGFSQDWQGYDYFFDSDIPLTAWVAEISQSDPFYDGSYLFMLYLYKRFGANFMKEIIRSNGIGLEHLNIFLRNHSFVDGMTQNPIHADDVWADWAVANLIDDTSLLDGRYGYSQFVLPAEIEMSDTFNACPVSERVRTVNQFGTDYIKITCEGDYSFIFSGDQSIKIVSTDAHSGRRSFWSNIGNESSMTLTRNFDFTQTAGPILMDYWNWYDLEDRFDYVYSLATTDGNRWDVLRTEGCKEGSEALACGLTGKSHSWRKSTLDLSAYAGKKVTLQIEYLTDLAQNGQGYLIDDVSIPAISYFTDFESDDGGWIPDGFVRIQNLLPQQFMISLVIIHETNKVERIIPNPDQSATVSFTRSGGTGCVCDQRCHPNYSGTSSLPLYHHH